MIKKCSRKVVRGGNKNEKCKPQNNLVLRDRAARLVADVGDPHELGRDVLSAGPGDARRGADHLHPAGTGDSRNRHDSRRDLRARACL